MTEPFELLVENGTIVDGSGEPGFAGAIGIRDGRLTVILGETEPEVAAAGGSTRPASSSRRGSSTCTATRG